MHYVTYLGPLCQYQNLEINEKKLPLITNCNHMNYPHCAKLRKQFIQQIISFTKECDCQTFL